MKNSIKAKLLYVLCMLCALTLSQSLLAKPVALLADQLIDGNSRKLIRGQVILIEHKHITSIVGRDEVPDDAQVIELPGMTLMPGMINLHEHPSMFSDDYQNAHLQTSSAYKALRSLAAVQAYLLAGWTSVRITGDADVFYGDIDLQKAINEGIFTGPRITGAGHYISITGGGGDVNFISPEQTVIADGLIADGADEIRKAVRTEAKYGSEWIKLLVTGAYMSVGDSPRNVAFSPEELRAAVEEANRLGLPVAAHAHADEGIRMAVEAGVRTIEHGTFISDESIKLMARKGTFLIPTIYVGDYYGEGDKLLAQEKNTEYFRHERPLFLARVGKAFRAGVKIGVGTDLGAAPENMGVLARELADLVEAGLTPMDAIQAATRVGAEALGWEDRLGTLGSGKLADIIGVVGNPLEDISVLENVSFVMLGGKIVKQPGGDNKLDGILE